MPVDDEAGTCLKALWKVIVEKRPNDILSFSSSCSGMWNHAEFLEVLSQLPRRLREDQFTSDVFHPRIIACRGTNSSAAGDAWS
jgi:hypothetical protein